jgi:hypothetical protein
VLGFVLMALALIGLGAGAAHAQPSYLSGGVFIAHHPPGTLYTDELCYRYQIDFAITSCEEENPTMNLAPSEQGFWYVLGAFDGDKAWCGAEFGLGNYDDNLISIIESGQCPTDALIIPSGNWPGPNAGVSIAATATSWSGNFQPVYWFVSYSYYGDPVLVQLTANPGTGFGGFANCMTPPTSYPASCFGAMGINMPGVPCCPAPTMPHACCIDVVCVLVLTADECTGMGGVDHPEWVFCDPNPCWNPMPPAVCCVGEECFFVPEPECDAMGGIVHPEYEDCGDPNPCEVPVPALPSSWGGLKALYR